VSLALFGAYVTRAKIDLIHSSILDPKVFAGLLVGAMLPYWFSAMTMKSVGKAALAMVEEVRHQFATIPGLMEGTTRPDYKRCAQHSCVDCVTMHELCGPVCTCACAEARTRACCLSRAYAERFALLSRCVEISTQAALSEMIPPGALVMLTPLIVGALFGTRTLAGVLAGALVSGVQMAVSMSNTGGAWDNAKKYVEAGATEHARELGGKGSDCHKAAVIGDTVGDPLKVHAAHAMLCCDVMLAPDGQCRRASWSEVRDCTVPYLVPWWCSHNCSGLTRPGKQCCTSGCMLCSAL
jgi:H+-translocating diphosphatase